MRRTDHFLLLSGILVLAGFACNTFIPTSGSEAGIFVSPTPISTRPPQFDPKGLPLTEADVPRISSGDAKAAFDSGEAVIVDVRDPGFYAQKHVSGAVSIPLNDIELDPLGFPYDRDQWIITYCT